MHVSSRTYIVLLNPTCTFVFIVILHSLGFTGPRFLFVPSTVSKRSFCIMYQTSAGILKELKNYTSQALTMDKLRAPNSNVMLEILHADQTSQGNGLFNSL